MKLVIVESPAKCTTIKRYLGDEYKVVASKGHIRDLATSGKGGLGVDVEHNFAPTYIINKDKQSIVKELKKDAIKCSEVILATDPDREGEAIAWHLAQVLNLDVEKTKRLEFHEITRVSIQEAMEKPRVINKDLVSSQETRRILDRIIGFKLSTLINRKIHSKSAGRVQTATLKMICDHDIDITKFVPEEYWTIDVKAEIFGKTYDLVYDSVNGENKKVVDGATAQQIIDQIPNDLFVIDVSKTVKSRESREPFTTSTLQQEAFSRLKFKTSKTQRIAQELYEGINVGGEHVGLISYMRTDSTRLSPTFVDRATKYITETFGKEYLGHPKHLKKIGLMQDAHEAIRPTSNHRTPESVKEFLTPEQFELYRLIYNRCLASLMKPKQEEIMEIDLDGNGVKFHTQLSKTIFKGYEILLKEKNSNTYQEFPDIQKGYVFHLTEKKCEQKFTQPPAHYSEAKLVKMMEEVGIGRPSTYASTIDILRKRKYIENSGGILTSTDQGKKTAHVLEKYFPEIINTKYTAAMEKKLDNIETGAVSSLEVLNDFYQPFIKQLDNAYELMYKDEEKEVGEQCPLCGAPLVHKHGKNGTFIGCSNYPSCRYRRDEPVKKCPNCETGYLVKKKGKFGYFLGCTNYPQCTHMEKLYSKRKRK